jgi:hypothetical protein
MGADPGDQRSRLMASDAEKDDIAGQGRSYLERTQQEVEGLLPDGDPNAQEGLACNKVDRSPSSEAKSASFRDVLERPPAPQLRRDHALGCMRM